MTTAHDTHQPHREIVENLATNLKLSEDLLATLHEEIAALKTMDTQGLFRLSHLKDSLLAKIHYLDDSLLRNSRTADGSGQTPFAIPTEEKRLIGQYQDRINAVRVKIKERNAINKRFTEDTLSCLGEAIALLTRPAQDEHTYRVPGRSQAKNRTLPSMISCEA